MIKFPQHLPLPTISGYSIKPDDAIIRTDMESGPARQRRRFTQTPSKIAVRWVMNQEQFSLFEAWYKFHAKEGAEWFDIQLLGGLGLLEQEARFIQQFEAGLYKGLLWEITAELEILLDSDPVKLGRTVERLHFLVHTFIPNKLNK